MESAPVLMQWQLDLSALGLFPFLSLPLLAVAGKPAKGQRQAWAEVTSELRRVANKSGQPESMRLNVETECGQALNGPFYLRMEGYVCILW